MTWDGTSQTRPNPSVLRAPDGYDWRALQGALETLETAQVGKAATTIKTGQILKSGLAPADPDENAVIGIAFCDAIPNQLFQYLTEGIVQRDDWTPISGSTNLMLGVDYFLAPGGAISLLPPLTGWAIKVGQAVTPKEFAFAKQVSVRL